MELLATIDFWFNWIYLGEFIIKVLGIGILNYYRDPWNCFDFLLIVLAFGTDTALNQIMKNAKTTKSAKAVKAVKGAKATKSTRMLKLAKL